VPSKCPTRHKAASDFETRHHRGLCGAGRPLLGALFEWPEVAGCRDCPGSPKDVGKPAAHREDQLSGWAAKANNRRRRRDRESEQPANYGLWRAPDAPFRMTGDEVEPTSLVGEYQRRQSLRIADTQDFDARKHDVLRERQLRD